MDRFPLGTRVQIKGVFQTDPSAPASDPDSPVSVTIRRPDQTTTVCEPDRLSAGEFAETLLLDTPGRWAVRFAAAGEVAVEQEFYVESAMVI